MHTRSTAVALLVTLLAYLASHTFLSRFVQFAAPLYTMVHATKAPVYFISHGGPTSTLPASDEHQTAAGWTDSKHAFCTQPCSNMHTLPISIGSSGDERCANSMSKVSFEVSCSSVHTGKLKTSSKVYTVGPSPHADGILKHVRA